MLATAIEDFEVILLVSREAIVSQENLSKANNGIQRRPQFVTHVGQKLTFGAVGGIGRFFSRLQIGGSLLYPLL